MTSRRPTAVSSASLRSRGSSPASWPVGQLDNSCVYINKVGNLGENCASYWWTRVAACGIRATRHFLGSCPIDMLLYADDLELLATTEGVG